MISRRMLIGSSAGVTVLAALPALAATEPPGLLIVDPVLLTQAPPRSAIVASGPVLMTLLLPRIDRERRLDAIIDEADRQMLHELVRFLPRIRWRDTSGPAGSYTFAGQLRRSACLVAARWE